MKYEVKMTRKASKGVAKLPVKCRDVLARLLCDIRDFGPVQPNYSHFSKLDEACFYCHLGYRWIACWRQIRGVFIVEVYYVGSRESAPY